MFCKVCFTTCSLTKIHVHEGKKWEPFMNQGMILAYVAFCVGLFLAILTFIIELLSGKKKQALQIFKHRDISQGNAWLEDSDKGIKETTRRNK